MKKIKIICIWIGGVILTIGLACITMPFVMVYPFLYIEYTFNPECTPGLMEDIIRTKPETIYDIEDRLYKNSIAIRTPHLGAPDFQDYQEYLERGTAMYIAEGKLNAPSIHWNHDKEQACAVKYIKSYETRTAWGRAKANMGDLTDRTTYYFLFDRRFRILGWLKEEE
ncbi:hypothetical protein [Akkermansia glycaniphila]|uniref:Uncharacterized protein n=1 Tax=Akkermansia glycaniphila TaxID=1679444 RepID=A0A1C7PE31_9BACT|nr:hypothetical protein [Akkermansia glycaniphila]OCA03815.1 hypothetical protein AC781_02550 [Akkermansia glycaniphila]SEH91591.1 Hypothetical protein PYTT_1690 [Akkermansia glycaniphila]